MNSIIKSLLLTLILMQGSALLSGQFVMKINGQVVTFGEIPLNNVEITSKKSDIKVFTDSQGFFSIEVPGGDKILIKANGFDEVGFKVKNFERKVINLVYSNQENSFKKATENGHISEDMLKEAIKTRPLKGDKDYSRYNSIYDVIDDEIFTVTVSGKSITTNKPNSFSGSQEVLLVVDGVIVSDISFVTPFNVKSVRYLDGTQAAIYGSRGANGVIEIVLKTRN